MFKNYKDQNLNKFIFKWKNGGEHGWWTILYIIIQSLADCCSSDRTRLPTAEDAVGRLPAADESPLMWIRV
jgi:hypothetical protein